MAEIGNCIDRGLTKVADVVVGVKASRHPNLKLRIARHAKLRTCAAGDPGVCSSQLVVAASGHTFHDLGRAGVEGQGGGQDHANRLFGSVGQGDAVADTLAVKVHIGGGGDGDVGDLGGGHGGCCSPKVVGGARSGRASDGLSLRF